MSTTPHRKKRVVTSLNTFCSVLPSHQPILSEEVFGVTEDTITFPDSRLENTSTYRFNHVFNGFRELQNAFEKAYAPMIRNVNNGENAMLVFGGLPITDSMDFFTSMNGRVGIINQAAQLLLRSNTISSSNNNTTVTLSWYKIDNKGTENISDLLRMSSSLHSTEPSGDHTHANKDSNLVLRELGKGRGMIVPGLWEVEVTKPQDVDAVIAHVQRMLPMAKHDGNSHSIIQLTVTPNDSYDDENKKSKLKEDSPDIGRLTFVLLSNASSRPLSNSSTSHTQQKHLELSPWVGQLEDILRWIDNKRPSPPFHKSRILLLLRDALCSRMTCGFSLFLQPTVEALSENTIWLQLLSHISSTNAERSSAINTLPIHSSVSVGPMLAATSNGVSMTKEQALMHNASRTSKSIPTTTTTTTTTPASSRSKSRFNASSNQLSKSAGKGILKNSNSKPSTNQQLSRRPQQHSQSHSRSQQQHQYTNDDFLHQLPPDDDMSAPFEHDHNHEEDVHSRDFDRHSHREERDRDSYSPHRGGGGIPPRPSPESVRQQELLQHQLHYQRQFYEQQQGSVPPPRSTPPANSQHQQPHQLLSPPPPPPGVLFSQQRQHQVHHDNIYDNSLLPPQSQLLNQQQQQHQQTSPFSASDENTRPRDNEPGSGNIGSGDSCITDRRDAETVEALLYSLQSSRDEVDSLKKSLLLCQQNLDFHKTEHEALKNAKEGAGRTLKSKDRERLKKALQELKDYEVYREVMEAAMSRMQNEIDKLESDNISHKQLSTHLEKELRKSKNITNKITRDTSEFEKSKVTLHERVSTAEKEAKRLARERDAAVLALSQYKAESAREEEDLKSSRRVKHKEVLELKKKLADVNMHLKMQIEEGETAAQLHAQEMKKLQTAHKKSLEMLMACQEENDLLRVAVADLEEDKAAAVKAAMKSNTNDEATSGNGGDRRSTEIPTNLSLNDKGLNEGNNSRGNHSNAHNGDNVDEKAFEQQ